MIFLLNVTYREKEQVKPFGAKWNGSNWYYQGDELPERLQPWFSGIRLTDEGEPYEETGTENADPFAEYASVSRVNQMISMRYDATPEFHQIRVRGEVTNYHGPNNGNYYFSLKDADALIDCRLFQRTAATALQFRLESGQQVAIRGDLDYYEKTGKSALLVHQIFHIGAGDLDLAFQQLKNRLRAEGLFSAEYKKPLPAHPKTIGIITSESGKAIGDIVATKKLRDPSVQLVLYPVKVQGAQAVRTIVEGIRALDAAGMDAIIVGRGGGSDEELKAYNEEAVARAVFDAVTPIVSAVGHEGNLTLTDFTADARASTPTQAVELLVPDAMAELRRVEVLSEEIILRMKNRLEHSRMQLRVRMETLEKFNPETQLVMHRERMIHIAKLLRNTMQEVLAQRLHRCEVLTARLNGLSPTAKLVGGFGYIAFDGKPLRSVSDVHAKDELHVTLHDGEIRATVLEIKETHPEE